MTAKEYLEQYRRLKIEIDSKTEQLEELREFAKSVSHSSGAGGHAGVSDKVGKTVAKIIDLENEISCQIDKLLELKKEIESTIAKVEDPVLRQILTLVMRWHSALHNNAAFFQQAACRLLPSRFSDCSNNS